MEIANMINIQTYANDAQSSAAYAVNVDSYEIDRYNKFLQVKAKNPTAADIAMRAAEKQNLTPAYLWYKRNVRLLEKSPENDVLVQQFKENYKQNYPKTGKLRKALIKNDRFQLDRVTPKMTSNLKKMFIKLTSII